MLLTQPRSSTSEVCLNVLSPDRDRVIGLQQTDTDSIQKLAMQARTDFYPTQVQQRRAMDKLLDALRFSGRLRGRGQYSVDVYDDAVKGIDFNPQIISWLAILCQLSQLRKVNRALSKQVFLDLTKMSLSLSPLRQVDEESHLYENLAQPEEQPCLLELIAAYLESDPSLLSRNHARNCPKATLKAILKARLEDRSWQEIADSFSLTVAVVKNFFFRQMKSVAPLIEQEILS